MAASRTDRLLGALARVGLGLWIGALGAIAFVAAPLVFGAVPTHVASKEAAARVIGPAFARVDVFGLLVGALVLTHLLRRRRARGARWRLGLVAGMMAAAAVDAFVLAPAITARQEPLGTYHGAAVVLWMLVLAAGTALMGAGITPGLRNLTHPAGP